MYGNGIFVCPLCKAPLSRENNSLFCSGERKHTYDIASSGYVNLLPPGKKSNAKTGDDKEMLRCRRRFLSGGYYDRISSGLARAALDCLSERESIIFADAGCGDGYHALNILSFFERENIKSRGIGFDASKHGADYAARLSKKEGTDAFFAAANIFDMPVSDKSLDIIFSMFAPVPDSEANRVLRDDGVLAVCSSGERHLWEMREVLYGEPRVSPPLDRTPEGFQKVFHSSLCYTFELKDKEDIGALFTMTPFYYRCPKEGRERLNSLECLSVTASVEYNIYKKK